MLDLDGFKDVNDSLGHQVGDRLLHAVGERLAREAAGHGRVFRLQGDEFVMLLDASELDAALIFVNDLVEAFGEPFLAGELELDVGISAGLARVGVGECGVDEILRRADAAMYEAKRTRVGFALYRAGRGDTGERGRQILSADLRRALKSGEIEVHYQPQCSLRTGAIESAEALVRWRRPDGTLIAPDQFIPQAERTRVMMPLTIHVLRTAIADCRRWDEEHGYDGRIAINVSARTLHHPSLVADVSAALDQSGMDARRLELEITESALMVDPEGARRTLHALHALGVDILIDDFGTGYSSMAYLSELPVDGIKVDRSFVAGMVAEHADLVIVRSTLDLGSNLGLRTIAEGVEDAVTRDRLAALGCELAQGWLWHPALPAAAFSDTLAEPAASRLAA
jgi:diguanylate cyclase (GGDEF)-like protein